MREKKSFEGPNKGCFCEVLVEELRHNGERFNVAVELGRLPRKK